MTEVWGRPSLAAGWRFGGDGWWGIVVLVLCRLAFSSYGVEFGVDTTALRSASRCFSLSRRSLPSSSVWLERSGSTTSADASAWLIPVAIVLWLVVAAVGRTIVLRRLDGALQPRRLAMLVLGALRAGLLAVVWGLWVSGVRLAVRISITGPASRQDEPSIVLFCAMLIVRYAGDVCAVGGC